VLNSVRLSLKPVDPSGMASHSGVSKNFMSFIDGLGIPCANDQMVLTSRTNIHDVQLTSASSVKRLLTSRQSKDEQQYQLITHQTVKF